jgi:polysaccharide export outer membrane protein
MVVLGQLLVALSVSLVVSLLSPAALLAQEYTIGPRDVLKITVWGHDDLSGDYPVAEDGFVPFPLLGRVAADGLTVKQFSARLVDLLGKDYLVNPQVFVSVKEYLSKKVHVFGETEKPGVYYLTGPTSLLEILSRAGAKTTSKQLIMVRPHRDGNRVSGSTILRLNLEQVQVGDTSQNIPVRDEDTIFVPRAQAFFVLGEVRSPGTFPLERTTTVLEAVSLAGGFTDKAAPGVVKLIRQKLDGTQETKTLELGGEARDRGVTLLEGDTVVVPRGNTYLVLGEVRSPGVYVLDRQMTVLDGIMSAGGFTEKASPGRTRVIRTTSAGQQQVINIDMNDIIKRGQRDKAIPLQESDVVVVPQSFF